MTHKERNDQTDNMRSGELVSVVKEVISRGDVIIIVNDIDQTVALGTEDDPRKTEIHPRIACSLRLIQDAGHIIGFNSNRSGIEIAAMSTKAGILNPLIIGSYGLELFEIDKQNPTNGVATIDERFMLYSEPVTETLRHLRQGLYGTLGLKVPEDNGLYQEIPTTGGMVILERKGICNTFPEGIAHGYNMNAVTPEVRAELVEVLDKEYEDLIRKGLERSYMETMSLQNVWHLNKDSWPPTQKGRYSWKVEPDRKIRPKAHGMMCIIREAQQRLNGKNIGLIITAGDDNSDADAMQVAARLVNFQQKASELAPAMAAGVWVNPGEDKQAAREKADIIVTGVDGYAQLLETIAGVIS